MSSLKTFACVGAVAMVAASAIITTASAADLAPPPAPLMPPPPPPIMESMGGLYLRGDVGAGYNGSSKVTSTITTPGFVVPDWRKEKSSFDGQGYAGAGIGYQFNNFLRFDVTGQYRTTSRFRGRGSYRDDFNIGCYGGRCYDLYDADLRTYTFLANGYLDMGTWRGITPFIGAGVGVAHHKIVGLTDIGAPNPGFGYAPDRSTNKFAWAFMAGLGFDVTRNLKMEIGYRYLDQGKISSNPIRCSYSVCPGEVHRYKPRSHDFGIGFRYLLNDDPAPMAPAVFPAAAPIARRY